MLERHYSADELINIYLAGPGYPLSQWRRPNYSFRCARRGLIILDTRGYRLCFHVAREMSRQESH